MVVESSAVIRLLAQSMGVSWKGAGMVVVSCAAKAGVSKKASANVFRLYHEQAATAIINV